MGIRIVPSPPALVGTSTYDSSMSILTSFMEKGDVTTQLDGSVCQVLVEVGSIDVVALVGR